MENNITLIARIVECIPSSVIVTTLSGKIKYVNAHSERYLGYKRQELTSMSIEDIIIKLTKDGSWQHIQNVIIKENSNYVGETCLVRKDRRTIICSTNGFYISNEQNEPEEIVLVLHDIAKEKSIAEELEKRNVEMSRKNLELINSNRELKRVSEQKTNFVSIASHELKTPLTSIMGYSEIIIENMKEKVDKNVYNMIESINSAAGRLHDIINNMLDITRIEQKRLRLKSEDMSLNETAGECIKELAQIASQRNITFNCDFEDNLPFFYGDKMRIHQVFTNLFSNALRYSPDNTEIEVKISIEKRDRFHIIVIDQGIGIDEEEIHKIFDPFYEIAGTEHYSIYTAKFMGGGMGLGLSIVKNIVERHGGLVWAESQRTKQKKFPGSKFHILFPVKSGFQWDDDETQFIEINKIMAESKKKYETTVTSDVKPTVLVIDDDRDTIEITRMVLQPSFEVMNADTGEDGLRMAFQHKPALILLDQYLPGLDGCQICRIFRTQEETKDIPISFFTAATQDSEIEQCYASGADDFILKPFNQKEMFDKVTRLVYEKRTKR